MTGPAEIFAMAAMIPALTAAPVPQVMPQSGESGAIVVALCNGGNIAIALDKDAPPVMGVSPCCAKGCQNSRRRKDQKGRTDPVT